MARKITAVEREEMKARRLALIKDRYRKLILEPRRQISIEIYQESESLSMELDAAD